MEKSIIADKYLTFDEKFKKQFTPEIVKLLIDTFNKVYINICDFFNNGELRNVVFETNPSFGSPALITITDDENGKVIENNKIIFNPNDAIFHKKPYNIDFITHELVHVAQDYAYGNSGYYPQWIVEGLADYGRAKFGIYNKESNWSLFKVLSNNKNYEFGYTIAGGFIAWLEKYTNTPFAKELNKIMKSGRYNENYFIKSTGKSIDELWQIYVKENRMYAVNWLEKHIENPLPKEIFYKIKSGELDDELDKYLFDKIGRTIDDIWEMYEMTI